VTQLSTNRTEARCGNGSHLGSGVPDGENDRCYSAESGRSEGAVMAMRRLEHHPILPVVPCDEVPFGWCDRALSACPGEVISSALMAHGVAVFGRHPNDGSPQGIYCANGQCAQCMVVADGVPVKACMTPVREGMKVEPLEGLPDLPPVDETPAMRDAPRVSVPVLVIGGGPAGLSAATQLGEHGIRALLVDDKPRLGGKLLLQTHRFFGEVNAVYAGTRGIDIAQRLEREATRYPTTEVWRFSTALAVYSDGWVGVLRDGHEYVLVKPEVLLVAAGAREKALTFRGNTLPGVYGAGAFQTLLNRDLVRAAERLFVIGGGNVGLITAYHALQAGITVVGLAEALPACGGYRVHEQKLARLGVPIHTSHTVVSANGHDGVESVTIARVDEALGPVPGSERSFACDTVLVAVGLDPVDEFTVKARDAGMQVFTAGDADEIAEASAAMFTGRIRGLEIARALGADVGEVPPDWLRTAELLKSRPGAITTRDGSAAQSGVHPVFHCAQEIPCNPCTSVCPQQLIHIDPLDIRKVPVYLGDALGDACLGCEKCLRVCPGLAITLVDYRPGADEPLVTIPFEFDTHAVQVGDVVTAVDASGGVLGNLEVTTVRSAKKYDGTVIVKLRAPAGVAERVAGIRIQQPHASDPLERFVERLEDDDVVCRCERVTAGELRALIREGYRDVNEIKVVARAGMGACGGKTCAPLIARLFRDEGVRDAEVTPGVRRPLFVEVPLGVFAGVREP
jgi:sarcosine oxidase, subunit alpha